eukprot:5045954-Prymnesium_polylepis.1
MRPPGDMAAAGTGSAAAPTATEQMVLDEETESRLSEEMATSGLGDPAVAGSARASLGSPTTRRSPRSCVWRVWGWVSLRTVVVGVTDGLLGAFD